jgi:hypothetical protein
MLVLLPGSTTLASDWQHDLARATHSPDAHQQLAHASTDLQNKMLVLTDFQNRAQKVRSQLEAISYMPEGMVSSRMLAYASQKAEELNGWDKRLKDAEEAVRQSSERYNALQQQTGSTVQPLGLIHSQNYRLMGPDTARNRPRIPPREQSTESIPAEAHADELTLCRKLERMASKTDYDIAAINLLAAKGLPGSEKLDVEKALKTLDLWATWVKRETDRHLYKFKQSPESFHNSEEYFRILMMVTVLQQDFKVKYHTSPEKRAGIEGVKQGDYSFYSDSKDLFIHGAASYDYGHQGTCASLPVLYVAIGRRLGYPLKLVTCKRHVFARWEDKKQKFNIEATSKGLNCFPDQEYREWPLPISDEEMKTGMFLKSLSPEGELAIFLGLRGLSHKRHGKTKELKTVLAYADKLLIGEGADIDGLRRIQDEYAKKNAGDDADGAVLFQMLTNTNSWRSIEHRRGGNEKHTVFAVERFDSE